MILYGFLIIVSLLSGNDEHFGTSLVKMAQTIFCRLPEGTQGIYQGMYIIVVSPYIKKYD